MAEPSVTPPRSIENGNIAENGKAQENRGREGSEREREKKQKNVKNWGIYDKWRNKGQERDEGEKKYVK